MSLQTEPMRRTGRLAGLVAIALVGAGLTVAGAVWFMAVMTPEHVDQVTIDNPTRYPVRVEVRGGPADGWLRVATVPPEGRIEAGRVLEQGAEWTFRFGYRDVTVEETRQRSALEARGWEVRVPLRLPAHLEAAGIPPPGRSPFDE